MSEAAGGWHIVIAGGAMNRLAKLIALGLGGAVGSGNQGASWIYVHDLDRLVDACIDDESCEGVYMTTDRPEAVTNRMFMRAMRRAYRRPGSPPVSVLAVKLASRFVRNNDSELALLGRGCVPTRLRGRHGFAFEYGGVEPTLRHIARG